MKHKLKWTVIGLTGIYLIAGFLIIPLVLEKKLPGIVSEMTGGSFRVASVAFNPLIARLDMYDMALTDPQGKEFFKMKRATVNVSVVSLVTGAVHLENITLFQPHITLLHHKDGSYNFDWLMQSKTSEPEPVSVENNSTSGELPHVIVDRFALLQGEVYYADMAKVKPFEIGLGPVGFELKDIDTADVVRHDDNIHIYAHISDGGFLDVKSDLLSLEPPAIRGSVLFESGALYTKWHYLEENFRLEVADGKTYLKFDFDVDMQSLGDMRIENLQFALKNLRVKPKSENGDVLHVGLLAVDNGTIEPMKQRVGIEGVRIDNVTLFAKREADGTVDWQRYTAPVETSDAEMQKEGEAARESNVSDPWLVTLDGFSMDRIKATFEDRAVAPAVTTTLNNLKMDAAHISSQGAVPLDYNLSLLINGAMHCQSSGNIAHTPLDINATSACQAIDLTWFRAYIDQAANDALEKYDIALTHGKVAFNAGTLVRETNASVSAQTYNTNISLSELTLRQQSNKALLLRLNRMNIGDIRADTMKQDLTIGEFVLNRPDVYARRDQKGAIDWAGVVIPKEEQQAQKQKSAGKAGEKNGEESAWTVGLKRFALNEGGVTFTDKSLSTPATSVLDWIEVDVRDIRSQKRSKMRYRTSMRVNKKGRLDAKGTLIHTPLQQKGSISLKNFQLSDLDPYVQEGTYVSIKRGALSLKANETYAASVSKPDLKLKGSLSITDFVANDTHDDSVLFAFEDITIDPYLFEYAPDKLFIEEVDMKTIYANVIIDENKTMNFAELVKEKVVTEDEIIEASDVESNSTKSEPFPVTIVKVAIDGSSTSFADFSLPLKFETYVHDVKGTVYAISTEPKEVSRIDMRGEIDRYGFAELKGALSSADPKYYTDLDVAFKNLALNNYSPYSAKFAGRKIDSGKLSVALGYKIDKSELKGDNSIIINKLKLGDDVESEDAVSLPLGLAIALLEDSDGVIDIDMPVEGDLSNPDFKYGAVVWGAFVNMITGIATSPFRFLGSMLGIDGDELKAVAFKPGAIELLPPEKEKLDTLAKALKKRPKLELGVTGMYDVKSDRYALQYAKALALVLSKIDADKMKKDETLALPIAEEILEGEFGEDALDVIRKKLHKEYEDDDTYREKYYAVLKEKLVGIQKVSDEELIDLASSRAKTIATYLEVETGTAPQRIKLEAVKNSRESGGISVENELSIEVNE